jgi:hypothetical protein
MTEIAKPTEIFLLDTAARTWAPLPAELRWSAKDPIACTVVFGVTNSEVTWTFAFDLMRAISDNRPAGVGDVRFDVDHLDPSYILLRLTSPDGKCTTRLKLVDVKTFVHRVIAAMGAQRNEDFVARSLDKALSAILKG